MTQETVILDPALLIWDEQDFDSRQGEYWEMTAEIMDLLDLFDQHPYQPLLSRDIAEVIITGFPADKLSQNAELRDFVHTIYGFLSKMHEVQEVYSQVTFSSLTPNVISRICFCATTKMQLSGCIARALSSDSPGLFASNQLVWTFQEHQIAEPNYPDKVIEVVLGSSGCNALRNKRRRHYEEHRKHHPTYGYGSQLPEGLTAKKIQDALDIAVALEGGRTLCAKVSSFNVVLIFRKHEKAKYHAYPIQASEYSKYKVDLAQIPEVP